MRRKKNIIIPIIIVAAVISIVIAKYKYTNVKYEDINYAAQKYITTGLFNKYKLYKIDNMKLSFSDGSISIITVSGVQDKAPYKTVTYNIFLEKDKKGLWKVKKVYAP